MLLSNTLLVLQELLQYWKTTYDWRKQEQILNKTMHHFSIPLNAIDLHFVHEKSKHKNAIPLLITHGWPGSFLEFTEIIPQLVNPGDKSMQTSPVPVLALLLRQRPPCLTLCLPFSYPCQACAAVLMLTWFLLSLQRIFSLYMCHMHVLGDFHFNCILLTHVKQDRIMQPTKHWYHMLLRCCQPSHPCKLRDETPLHFDRISNHQVPLHG